MQIIQGIQEGLNNKEIATKLGIVEKTVKFHITDIHKTLGTKNRVTLLKVYLSQYNEVITIQETEKISQLEQENEVLKKTIKMLEWQLGISSLPLGSL